MLSSGNNRLTVHMVLNWQQCPAFPPAEPRSKPSSGQNGSKCKKKMKGSVVACWRPNIRVYEIIFTTRDPQKKGQTTFCYSYHWSRSHSGRSSTHSQKEKHQLWTAGFTAFSRLEGESSSKEKCFSSLPSLNNNNPIVWAILGGFDISFTLY